MYRELDNSTLAVVHPSIIVCFSFEPSSLFCLLLFHIDVIVIREISVI